MRRSDLTAAIDEAKRFLRAADQALDAIDKSNSERKPGFGWSPPNKQTAAVRRASMDLTRSLAVLRRGGRT